MLTSFVQPSFLGGEISQAAQGRMDLPVYRQSLNVCLNAIILETGAWVPRPGTQLVCPTRGGRPGRVIPFPFAQSFPYVMEYTDGYLRFTTGPNLAQTNDSQTVSSISTANPAKVATALAHGWSTGNTVLFPTLSGSTQLQNRQFLITVTSSTEFTLADAVTGTNIDGATLAAFVSGTVARVLEIATPYADTTWSALRSVQAETRSVLLHGSYKPRVLQVTTAPSTGVFANFSLGTSDFIDGPYLDPIVGSICNTPSQNGVITLTFSYQAYAAGRAYNIGDFVTYAGTNYQSLTALNQNNQPDTHPVNWKQVNGGTAINGGRGFVASDIGRLIRLFNEPPAWVSGNTYNVGANVSYPDVNGGNTYWISSTNGNLTTPSESASWVEHPTGGTWTWGQITAVSGTGLIAPVATRIGTLTGNGGLASIFDGTLFKTITNAGTASNTVTTYPPWVAGIGYNVGQTVYYGGYFWTVSGSVPLSTSDTPGTSSAWTLVSAAPSASVDAYAGQDFHTAPKAIYSATVYPATDQGFGSGLYPQKVTLNLRAKQTAPTSASDGTLLGTSGAITNTSGSVSILSNDTTTTWAYVWIEIKATFPPPLNDTGSHTYTLTLDIAQIQFYQPNVDNGSVISVQIRGDGLFYIAPINTWRLGVYSDTTGWPTCGVYHEGRIGLGGGVAGRFDFSVSNGLNGVQLDFTPTNKYGVVADNNAISYTCTGKDVNQFLWLEPDQQGVLGGTQAGEWLISAPTAGPLSPTNVKAVRVTKIGCANIEPKRAEHTLLFVQRFGRKIMEYFADVFSGKFSAPNLTERSKHLTVSGIAELAYQQELAPIAWARRGDGALIGFTYKRESLVSSQGPTFVAAHRHTLGSGRIVESICVGPSFDGTLDTLSMVTNDVATGVRHIELMTDLLDEGFALTACKFLDDHIIPTSTSIDLTTSGSAPYGSLILNGLWALNGKTVSAFIAGLDCGDYTVSNGSITVPFGDGISGGTGSGLFTRALVNSFATLPAVIGFTYNSDGQLVRTVTPQDTGAQAGPGFAKNRRYHRLSAQLYGAVNGSIKFGTDFTKLDAAKLRYPNDTAYAVNVLWSGVWRDNANSIYDFDGMVAWRIARPLPGFVTAVGAFGAAQDA